MTEALYRVECISVDVPDGYEFELVTRTEEQAKDFCEEHACVYLEWSGWWADRQYAAWNGAYYSMTKHGID